MQTETSQHERSPLVPKGINVVNEEKPSVFRIGSSEMPVEGETCFISTMSTTIINNNDKSFEKLSTIAAAGEAPGYPRKVEQATVKLDQKKSLEISDEPSILDKIFNTAINLNSGDSSNSTQVSLLSYLFQLTHFPLKLKMLLSNLYALHLGSHDA